MEYNDISVDLPSFRTPSPLITLNVLFELTPTPEQPSFAGKIDTPDKWNHMDLDNVFDVSLLPGAVFHCLPRAIYLVFHCCLGNISLLA